MNQPILVGVDGGGTYTRVAVTDPAGNLLSYVKRAGASSLNKDKNAKDNYRAAVLEAVAKAGCTPGDVLGVGSGIAGFDSGEDEAWVREVARIDEINCPARLVNDSVAAQAGAFFMKPGIIAISGTGSIIFGVTESGRQIRNLEFGHYATAARFLSYSAVQEIIANAANPADGALAQRILDHFQVEDVASLARLASEGFVQDKRERMRLFGEFAPAITRAALEGIPLAKRICDRAAEALIVGIRLLGACFEEDCVSAALIGAVANSAYIKNAILQRVNVSANKRYAVAEPALPAALGAVLLAMELAHIPLEETVAENLRRGAEGVRDQA